MATSKKSFLQNWNLDRTLSLMAFLISLGTFFLLYYQTNLTRKQQYASVFPYLELFNQGPKADIYIFALTNKGIGPAFIKQVEVSYKDSIFQMDPIDFFYSEIYPKDTLAFANGILIHSNLPEGTLIPAGATVEIFKLEGSVEVANKLRALFSHAQARLQIVYTSVYEEEWVLRTGNFPEKIK